MSKYEFKPFCNATYYSDLAEGWKPTYRGSEEYQGRPPREAKVTDIGELARPDSRIISIDVSRNGEVYHHDVQGRFDLSQTDCCLDLIMYREVKPQIEFRGVAYVSENGKIISVSPDYHDQEAETCRAVRCTITLMRNEP